MRRVLLSLLLSLPACLELSTGDGSADTTGAASAGSDAAPAITGVDCITEQGTGAVLCSGISACSNLYVDHDLFPTCGFRPNGANLDLECACDQSLCPIGVATSCEDAKKLLTSGQSQLSVCSQAYEGRCTVQKGASSSTKVCNDECLIRCSVADEGCPKRCGCA